MSRDSSGNEVGEFVAGLLLGANAAPSGLKSSVVFWGIGVRDLGDRGRFGLRAFP